MCTDFLAIYSMRDASVLIRLSHGFLFKYTVSHARTDGLVFMFF